MSKRSEDSQEYVVISVAAEMTGMHAQTLRTYDRLGLVTPKRTRGGGRRYSKRDIMLLRRIQYLSQEEGVNLAGIKTIIELNSQVEELQEENDRLRERIHATTRPKGEIVHVPRSTAVVAWEPASRRRRADRTRTDRADRA